MPHGCVTDFQQQPRQNRLDQTLKYSSSRKLTLKKCNGMHKRKMSYGEDVIVGNHMVHTYFALALFCYWAVQQFRFSRAIVVMLNRSF